MIRPILIWRPVVLGPFVADVLHTRQNRKQFFPRAAADERPNILLVMVDDMGYSDIGCYGGEVRTPTLDALAEKGVRLARFYNCAQCCPTRASLMTWLYPHQAGVGDMNDQGAANELWRRIGSPAYLGFKNRASSPCRRRCVRRAIRLSWPGNGISVRTNPAGRVSAGLTGISRSSAVLASSSPVIARDKRRGGGKAVKRRFPVDRRSRSKTAPATFSALKRCTAEEMKLLNLAIVCAEKMPDDLRIAFKEKFGFEPTEGYGTTEMSPVASFNTPDSRLPPGAVSDSGTRHGTVGRVIPGCATAVFNPETGEKLGANQEGLLKIKGPNIMLG